MGEAGGWGHEAQRVFMSAMDAVRYACVCIRAVKAPVIVGHRSDVGMFIASPNPPILRTCPCLMRISFDTSRFCTTTPLVTSGLRGKSRRWPARRPTGLGDRNMVRPPAAAMTREAAGASTRGLLYYVSTTRVNVRTPLLKSQNCTAADEVASGASGQPMR